jgi:hypothetical protein
MHLNFATANDKLRCKMCEDDKKRAILVHYIMHENVNAAKHYEYLENIA